MSRLSKELRETAEGLHEAGAMDITTRRAVFDAIDSERDYQDLRWGHARSSGNPGAGERTIDEFALYISGYADDLKQIASHESDPLKKLEVIRKITGLGVACMEQHGAPLRKY